MVAVSDHGPVYRSSRWGLSIPTLHPQMLRVPRALGLHMEEVKGRRPSLRLPCAGVIVVLPCVFISDSRLLFVSPETADPSKLPTLQNSTRCYHVSQFSL